jgi:hypothetical protein
VWLAALTGINTVVRGLPRRSLQCYGSMCCRCSHRCCPEVCICSLVPGYNNVLPHRAGKITQICVLCAFNSNTPISHHLFL